MTISSELVDSWKQSGIECCFITEPGEILLKTMDESLLKEYSHGDFTTFDDLRRSVGTEIRIYGVEKTIIVHSIDPLKLVGRFRRFHGVYRDRNAKNLRDLIRGFVNVLNNVVEYSGMKEWKHELLHVLLEQLNSNEYYNIKKYFNYSYIYSAKIFITKEKLFGIVNSAYRFFKNFDIVISKSSVSLGEKPRKVYIFITPYSHQYIEIIFDKEKIKSKLMDALSHGSLYYSGVSVTRYVKSELRSSDDMTGKTKTTRTSNSTLGGLDTIIDYLSYASLVFVMFILLYLLSMLLDWFIAGNGWLPEPISGILIRILILVIFILVYFEFSVGESNIYSENSYSNYYSVDSKTLEYLMNVCSSICRICSCNEILNIVRECSNDDEFLNLILNKIFTSIKVDLEEVLY